MKSIKKIVFFSCIVFFHAGILKAPFGLEKGTFTSPKRDISKQPRNIQHGGGIPMIPSWAQEMEEARPTPAPPKDDGNVKKLIENIKNYTIPFPDPIMLADILQQIPTSDKEILEKIDAFFNTNFKKIINPSVCKLLLQELPKVAPKALSEKVQTHFQKCIKQGLSRALQQYRSYFEKCGVMFSGNLSQQFNELRETKNKEELQNKVKEIITPTAVNPVQFTQVLYGNSEDQWWEKVSSGNVLVTLGDPTRLKEENPEAVIMSPTLVEKLIKKFKDPANENFYETYRISISFPEFMTQLPQIEQLCTIIKTISAFTWENPEIAKHELEDKIWGIRNLLAKAFTDLYMPKFKNLEEQLKQKQVASTAEPEKAIEVPPTAPTEVPKEVEVEKKEKEEKPSITETAKTSPQVPAPIPSEEKAPPEPAGEQTKEEAKPAPAKSQEIPPPISEPEKAPGIQPAHPEVTIEKTEVAPPAAEKIVEEKKEEAKETTSKSEKTLLNEAQQRKEQEEGIHAYLETIMIDNPQPQLFKKYIGTIKKSPAVFSAFLNFLNSNAEKITNPLICKTLLDAFPSFKEQMPEDIQSKLRENYNRALLQQIAIKINELRKLLEECGAIFARDLTTITNDLDLTKELDENKKQELLMQALMLTELDPIRFIDNLDFSQKDNTSEQWKKVAEGNLSSNPQNIDAIKTFLADLKKDKETPFPKLPKTFNELKSFDAINNLCPEIEKLVHWKDQGKLIEFVVKEILQAFINAVEKANSKILEPTPEFLTEEKNLQPAIIDVVPKTEITQNIITEPSTISPESKTEPSLFEPSEQATQQGERKEGLIEEEKQIKASLQKETQEAKKEIKKQQEYLKKFHKISEKQPEKTQTFSKSLEDASITNPNVSKLQKSIHSWKKSPEFTKHLNKFLVENNDKITDPFICKTFLNTLTSLKVSVPDNVKQTLIKHYNEGLLKKIEELRNTFEQCGVIFSNTLESTHEGLDLSSELTKIQQLKIVQNALKIKEVDPTKFVEALDFTEKKDDDPNLWKKFAEGTAEKTPENCTTLNNFLNIIQVEKAEKVPFPQTFTELKEYKTIKNQFFSIANNLIEENIINAAKMLNALSWEIINHFITALENKNKELLKLTFAKPQLDQGENQITDIEPIPITPAEKEAAEKSKEERLQKHKNRIEDTQKEIEAELEKLKEALRAQNLKNLNSISGTDYERFPTLLSPSEASHGPLKRPSVSQASEAIASLRHSLEQLGFIFKRPVMPGWIDSYFWGSLAGYDALSSAIDRILKSEGLTKKTIEQLLEIKEPDLNEKNEIRRKTQGILDISEDNLDIKTLFNNWPLWGKVKKDLVALSPFFNAEHYIEQIALLILKVFKKDSEYEKLPPIIKTPKTPEIQKTIAPEKEEKAAVSIALATATADQKITSLKDDIPSFRKLWGSLLKQPEVSPEDLQKALEGYTKYPNKTLQSAPLFRLVELKSIPEMQTFFQNQKNLKEMINTASTFLKNKAQSKRLINNFETLNVMPLGYENTIDNALQTAIQQSVSSYIQEKIDSAKKGDEAAQDKQLRELLKELRDIIKEEPALAAFPTLFLKIKTTADSVAKQIVHIATELIQKGRSFEQSLCVLLKEKNIQPFVEKLIPPLNITNNPNIEPLFALEPFTTIREATTHINPATILFKEADADAQLPLEEFYKKHIEPRFANFPQQDIEQWDKYKEYDETFKKLKGLKYIGSDIRTISAPLVVQSLNIVIAHNLKTHIEKNESKGTLLSEIEKIQALPSYQAFSKKEDLNQIYNDAKARLKQKELEAGGAAGEAGAGEGRAQTPEELRAQEEKEAAQQKAKEKVDKKFSSLYQSIQSARTFMENLGFEFENELPPFDTFKTFIATIITSKQTNYQEEIKKLLEWKPQKSDASLNTLDNVTPLVERMCINKTLFVTDENKVQTPSEFVSELLQGLAHNSIFSWLTNDAEQSFDVSLRSLAKQGALSQEAKNDLLAKARWTIALILVRAYIKKYRTQGKGAEASASIKVALDSPNPPRLENLIQAYDDIKNEINEAISILLQEPSKVPLPLRSAIISRLNDYLDVIEKAKTEQIPHALAKKKEKQLSRISNKNKAKSLESQVTPAQ